MTVLYSWFGFGLNGTTVAQIIHDAKITQLTIERENAALQHAILHQQIERDLKRRSAKNRRAKDELEYDIECAIKEFAMNKSPEDLSRFRDRAANEYRTTEFSRIRCALAMTKLKIAADLNLDLIMLSPAKYQSKLVQALNQASEKNLYNPQSGSSERQFFAALDLISIAQTHNRNILSKVFTNPSQGVKLTKPEEYSAASITDGSVNFRLYQKQKKIRNAYDRAAKEAGRLFAINSAITRALVSNPVLANRSQPKSFLGLFKRKDVATLIAERIDQADSILNERLGDNAYIERLMPVAAAMTNIDDEGCVAGFSSASIYDPDEINFKESFIPPPPNAKSLEILITAAWKAYNADYEDLVRVCVEQSVINQAIYALSQTTDPGQTLPTALDIERSILYKRNYQWGQSALGIKTDKITSEKSSLITHFPLKIRQEFDKPLKEIPSRFPSTWSEFNPGMANFAVLERIELCRQLIEMTSQSMLAVNFELVAAARSLANAISADKLKIALDDRASVDEWIQCVVKEVADDSSQVNIHCTEANRRYNAQLDHYLSPLIYVENFDRPLCIQNEIINTLA